MAKPMNCDNECGTLAFVLWTQIENGEVQAYCAPCLAEVCAGVAEQAGLFEDLLTKKLAELEAAKVIRFVPQKAAKPAKAAAQPEPGPDDESDQDRDPAAAEAGV